MAEPKERSRGERFNTLVQTIGIIIAAVWGIYTFIYKEIMLPKSAPINISINLQLKKIGAGAIKRPKKSLEAIEMKIAGGNPSSREVHLLKSAWIAYGYTIKPAVDGSLEKKEIIPKFNSGDGSYLERHSSMSSTSVIAGGNLFLDSKLKPSETVTRTIVFHVPANKYDLIEVYAFVPTAAKSGQVLLDWDLPHQTLTPIMYRVRDGTREPMKEDPSGGYEDLESELQMAFSSASVSLWE